MSREMTDAEALADDPDIVNAWVCRNTIYRILGERP